jgi:hypothetical protein
MNRKIAKVDSASLIKDINEGILSKQELVDKHNYSNLQSLSASIYWFRKKGLITVPKLRVSHILTDKQKVEFFKDHNNGVSSLDLLKKYNFNNLSSVYNLISKLKKISSKKDTVVKKDIVVKKVSNPVPSVVIPKVVTTSIRTIKFPDGFTIQIEKQFISGVLIHENGNITIIK